MSSPSFSITRTARPGAILARVSAASTSPPPSPPLLQAQGLARSVAGRRLWHGLDLTLHAGERLGVVGPSGSGKSLLLRTLAGLDATQAGEVQLRGRPQAEWAMPEYRARVMYLPQRPALLGGGTVQDELRRPFRLRVHAGRTFDAGRAAQLAGALGRPASFLGLEAATLSGGEGQSVALLRALLLAPDVLLLDEASASLDPEAVELAETLLLEWSRGPGRALIWVSHDPAQRARVSTRLLPLTAVSP